MLKLGISSCLLGNKVRYDGGDEYAQDLVQHLGTVVEYVPVCPEYECGLGVPREPIRLVGDPANPRVIGVHSRRDYTNHILEWASQRVAELARLKLCGFIFKSKSPSCGLSRVKVYDAQGLFVRKGVGLWARMFRQHFPAMPLLQETSLLESVSRREEFIRQIRCYCQQEPPKPLTAKLGD